MSIGLVLGLFASLAWGVVDVAAAVTTRRVGSLRVLVGSQVVSIVVLVGLVLARPDLLGTAPAAAILAGLPLGLLAAFAYLAYFTALRLGPVSIVSPVIVAYGGATVVLAVLFRGETLTPLQALGAVCATLGVVLAGVALDGSGWRGARLVGPGVVAALATMAGFAIVTILLAGPIREHGWAGVVLGSRIANAAASLVLLGLARRGTTRLDPLLSPDGAWSRGALAWIVIAGGCDVAAFVAYAIGLGVAPAWLVGLASSFGPVLAVGYAVGWLGERPQRSQWVGLALIAAGVLVLAVAI